MSSMEMQPTRRLSKDHVSACVVFSHCLHKLPDHAEAVTWSCHVCGGLCHTRTTRDGSSSPPAGRRAHGHFLVPVASALAGRCSPPPSSRRLQVSIVHLLAPDDPQSTGLVMHRWSECCPGEGGGRGPGATWVGCPGIAWLPKGTADQRPEGSGGRVGDRRRSIDTRTGTEGWGEEERGEGALGVEGRPGLLPAPS